MSHFVIPISALILTAFSYGLAHGFSWFLENVADTKEKA